MVCHGWSDLAAFLRFPHQKTYVCLLCLSVGGDGCAVIVSALNVRCAVMWILLSFLSSPRVMLD